MDSKAQYERVFKKWGFRRKYISKIEWQYIDFRLAEREVEGKRSSTVTIRDELIPEIKIRKQRKNYEMTTFERFHSGKFGV